MRVLVTGASGFIGYHLLPRLVERGFSVHAVSRHQPDLYPAKVNWYRADLLEGSAGQRLVARVRPQYLLHLAWCTRPGSYQSSPENVAWLYRTVQLVRQFAQSGGRRVVLAGTCFEYGLSSRYCHEEETPLLPHTLYGICKRSTWEILQRMVFPAGFSFGWARLFYLYGPGQAQEALVPSVIRAVSSGKVFTCLSGNAVRDYLYVEDAAEALVRLLESRFAGAVNLGSGRGVKVSTIVKKIASLIGRSDLIRFCWRKSQEPARVVAETTRMKAVLNWEPNWSLRKGLKQVVATISLGKGEQS
ncbi:MAG TPA: NAD(P)-dependent oxidoreductase [bacterium]|nr:NAD(P)-dependent oxidoreductase [bacterium]